MYKLFISHTVQHTTMLGMSFDMFPRHIGQVTAIALFEIKQNFASKKINNLEHFVYLSG